MGITVLKQNVPWGPFTREQIDEGIFRGDFTVRSLAHAPGLNEWLPLGEVLDYLHRAGGPPLPTLPPVPPPRELPPVPGAVAPKPAPPVLPTMQSVFEPAAPPPLIPRAKESAAAKPTPIPPPPPVPQSAPKPETQLPPASLFTRGIALFIDYVILFGPVVLVYVIGALAIEIPGAWSHIEHESRMQEWAVLERNSIYLLWMVLLGFGWLYNAGLECSRSQATVGKRWMGIKITDARSERLTFFRASGRYVAKYLPIIGAFFGFSGVLPLWVGIMLSLLVIFNFFAALFSTRRLALHDRIAGTRVVRNLG